MRRFFRLFDIYIVGLTILSVVVICSPLIFLLFKSEYDVRRNIFLSGTKLAHTLKTSEKLRTSYSCCIAMVIPMAVDLVMDFYLKLKGFAISTQWNERFILSLAISIPSLTYVCLSDSPVIPGVYIMQFYAQFIVLAAVICNSVISDYKKKSSFVLPFTLYLSFFMHCLKSCLRVYAIILGVHSTLDAIADVAVMAVCVLIYFNFIYWWYLTLRNPKKITGPHEYAEEDYRCAIYMSALPLYTLWAVVAAIVWPFQSWEDNTESLLVSYVVGQVLVTILVSVLPGRITRMNAIVNMEMLALKQVFVRYISHEIRSPLNVVHAGLDLLRSELQSVVSLSNSTLELVEDIFTSSESAINILNDLLSYEYIDAGIFDLELSYKPLMQLFEGQLQWAELLAKNSDISFIIQDDTVSTESGVQSCVSRMLSEATTDFAVDEPVITFEESVQKLPLANAYVRIDELKIEKVIRILVANAIKSTPMKKCVALKISCQSTISSPAKVDDVSRYLRVEVTDSGMGFAAADRLKVLGDVSQFRRSELEGGGGSGLSLWLARRIIDMHQGRMGVTSAGIGLGSTFYFEIPLYVMKEDADDSKSVDFTSFRGCDASNMELHIQEDPPPSKRSTTNVTLDKEDPQFSSESHLTVEKYPSNNAANEKEAEVDCAKKLFDSTEVSSKLNASEDIETGNFDVQKESNSRVTPTKRGSFLAVHYHTPRVYPKIPSPDRRREMSRSPKKKINLQFEKCHQLEKKPLQILIADDSGLNRKIVRRILESAPELIPSNSCIYEADDGTTAIAEMKNLLAVGTTMDIVLIDFVMIAMNGPEAVKIMRGKLHFNGVVIGITGNALQEDVATFLLQGADQILIKPITKVKLIDTLYSFMDKIVAHRSEDDVVIQELD